MGQGASVSFISHGRVSPSSLLDLPCADRSGPEDSLVVLQCSMKSLQWGGTLIGIGFSLYQPPTHDCVDDLGLGNLIRIDSEYILREHHYIGQQPGTKHTFVMLGEFRKGAITRVSAHRFLDCDSLFRDPALCILAIDRLSRYCSVNTQKRRQRRYSPV